MTLKITMREIAAAADVSVATVSRVFNNLHTGEVDIRERVLKTAQTLGYTHRSRVGDGLLARQGKRTAPASLVMHSLLPIGTYGGDILQGMEEEASKNGHRVYFSSANHNQAILGGGGGIPREVGIVASGVINMGDMSEKLRADAELAGMPIVQVNARLPTANVNCVMCDNFAASYRAVNWLLARGHRRVACIASGVPGVLSTEERAMGYRMALLHAGIPMDAALFQQIDGFGTPDGYAAMIRLSQVTPRPTAVFGVVDEVAVGAILAAKGLRLRVPEDLSVIGMNDLPMAEVCDPPLTTVRILRKEMGRAAVQRLLELIEDPDQKPRRIDVLCEFVDRGSCAGPPPRA